MKYEIIFKDKPSKFITILTDEVAHVRRVCEILYDDHIDVVEFGSEVWG